MEIDDNEIKSTQNSSNIIGSDINQFLNDVKNNVPSALVGSSSYNLYLVSQARQPTLFENPLYVMDELAFFLLFCTCGINSQLSGCLM